MPINPASFSRSGAIRVCVALAVAACLTAGIALAQRVGAAKIKGFGAPLEYHDPPHETRIRTLLDAQEAEPESGGLVRLTGVKLQMFDVKGRTEITVETPQCTFDAGEKTVSSSGPLSVESPDSGFRLQGQGFLWRQTNFVLIISNQVRAGLRGNQTDSLMR